MSETVSKPNLLALSDFADEEAVGATWIGSFLALGSRLSRFGRDVNNRQVILAISVPKRDFVAALIGCGWVLVSNAPSTTDPLSVFRTLSEDQPIRVANRREIILDRFRHLDETKSPPHVRLARSTWSIGAIAAVAPVSDFESAARIIKPEPEGLAQLAGMDRSWDMRLVSPEADLAIVGTLTWLRDDLSAFIGPLQGAVEPSSVESLLQPYYPGCATWFTKIYSAATLSEHLPLPITLRGVILDGNSAIKYVSEITAAVVVCIIDRSVVDQTASELLVQLRNSRSEPTALSDLGWDPPLGVEAMAFSVPL